MTVRSLINPIPSGTADVTLPDAGNWMQGRTLYGGASALVAFTHAMRTLENPPPLRAGQVAFVAPLGESFAITTDIVRQGRSVTQARTDITVEGETALTAFWLFGAGRDANALHPAPIAAPDAGDPADAPLADASQAPAFLKNNFEVAHTPERRAKDEPVIRRWARLTDRGVLDPVSELILLGDTLPPSAARIMQRPGPMSSINWSFNLLDTAPQTTDGWWLAETASDHADDGYSSERLRLWNADGKQMLAGMQCAAIFG